MELFQFVTLFSRIASPYFRICSICLRLHLIAFEMVLIHRQLYNFKRLLEKRTPHSRFTIDCSLWLGIFFLILFAVVIVNESNCLQTIKGGISSLFVSLFDLPDMINFAIKCDHAHRGALHSVPSISCHVIGSHSDDKQVGVQNILKACNYGENSGHFA